MGQGLRHLPVDRDVLEWVRSAYITLPLSNIILNSIRVVEFSCQLSKEAVGVAICKRVPISPGLLQLLWLGPHCCICLSFLLKWFQCLPHWSKSKFTKQNGWSASQLPDNNGEIRNMYSRGSFFLSWLIFLLRIKSCKFVCYRKWGMCPCESEVTLILAQFAFLVQ